MCKDVPCIKTGDFNAHVGTLDCGNVNVENVDWKCKKSKFVSKQRFSRCSSKVDPRGRSFNRFCLENNLILLNGRCWGDPADKSTYQVGLGESIHTVIDFVVCNYMECINM